MVNSAAPIGSVARFNNVAISKYRSTDKLFNAKIGLIIEDWETGNFLKFPWQFTNTAKPWTIDPTVHYEKLFSAKSGTITDSESTGIFLEYNVSVNDSISFYKRTSSQGIRDVLKFYIDEMVVGMWSGFTDTAFVRVAYPVLAGPHTFKWIYEKNNTISAGSDAVWVDYIVFPPRYVTSASAGGDAEICAGEDFHAHGMADNYDSLRWITDGTGAFSDATILDPLYTPSALDISNGMVRLKLSAYGKTSVDTNSMMLMINTPPTASAGGNVAVCKGTSYQFSASASMAYSTLYWVTNGDGLFDNPTILHPVYTPGAQDITHGSVKLHFYATGSSVCPVAADSLLLTIHALPLVDLGKDTVACANTAVVLNATYPTAASYLWLPSNKTTPSITVDSAGIGLHSQKVVAIVTDNNGCAGKDSVTVAFKVCGGINELPGVSMAIYPNPNNGLFSLQVTTAEPQKFDLEVTTQAGIIQFSKTGFGVNGNATEKIDLSALPQGAYILTLSNGSGKLVRKIVINK
jgi:hypothetical protein